MSQPIPEDFCTDDEQHTYGPLLVEFCRIPGVRAWRQNTGQRVYRASSGKKAVFRAGPPTGAADLSGVVRPEGWRLEVEVKVSVDSRTDEQLKWCDLMVDAGAVYLLVIHDPKVPLLESARRWGARLAEVLQERRSEGK